MIQALQDSTGAKSKRCLAQRDNPTLEEKKRAGKKGEKGICAHQCWARLGPRDRRTDRPDRPGQRQATFQSRGPVVTVGKSDSPLLPVRPLFVRQGPQLQSLEALVDSQVQLQSEHITWGRGQLVLLSVLHMHMYMHSHTLKLRCSQLPLKPQKDDGDATLQSPKRPHFLISASKSMCVCQ